MWIYDEFCVWSDRKIGKFYEIVWIVHCDHSRGNLFDVTLEYEVDICLLGEFDNNYSSIAYLISRSGFDISTPFCFSFDVRHSLENVNSRRHYRLSGAHFDFTAEILADKCPVYDSKARSIDDQGARNSAELKSRRHLESIDIFKFCKWNIYYTLFGFIEVLFPFRNLFIILHKFSTVTEQKKCLPDLISETNLFVDTSAGPFRLNCGEVFQLVKFTFLRANKFSKFTKFSRQNAFLPSTNGIILKRSGSFSLGFEKRKEIPFKTYFKSFIFADLSRWESH